MPRPKKRTDVPVFHAPTGGGRGDGQIVMAWQLAELLNREIPKIEERCRKEPTGNDGWAGRSHQQEGIGVIAFDVSYITGDKQDSVVRKLWGIRNGERRTTDVGFADALCLALDTTLANEDIAVLPGSMRGAYEMVDGFQFMHGKEDTGDDPLAKSLYNFTKGFIYWESEITLP